MKEIINLYNITKGSITLPFSVGYVLKNMKESKLVGSASIIARIENFQLVLVMIILSYMIIEVFYFML